MDDPVKRAALEYHRLPRPGKIAVTPTKALTNQQDLSMAYSPGVAAACEEIVADAAQDARIIAPGSPAAVGWQVVLSIVSVGVAVHLVLAIAREGV